MRRFLEFVVEETLAGRASQICEYAVATSAFDRDESFSPGLDPIVRNDARRLRQKLLEYYHRSERGRDDQIIIEVPKGGYVPVFRPVTHPEPATTRGSYRLVARLIRIEDGAEVWNADCNFQFNERSDDSILYIRLSADPSATTAIEQVRLLG